MEAAVELVAADQGAPVFQILDKTAFIYKNIYPSPCLGVFHINTHYAAQLAALVAAAGALLAAAFLTREHQLLCKDKESDVTKDTKQKDVDLRFHGLTFCLDRLTWHLLVKEKQSPINNQLKRRRTQLGRSSPLPWFWSHICI